MFCEKGTIVGAWFAKREQLLPSFVSGVRKRYNYGQFLRLVCEKNITVELFVLGCESHITVVTFCVVCAKTFQFSALFVFGVAIFGVWGAKTLQVSSLFMCGVRKFNNSV